MGPPGSVTILKLYGQPLAHPPQPVPLAPPPTSRLGSLVGSQSFGTFGRCVSSARSSGTKAEGNIVGCWCARVPSKVCNGGANVAMDRQPLSKAQPCKDACAFGLLHPTAPKPHSIGVEIRGSATRGKLYGAFRGIRSSEWCDGSTALRSNACSGILFRF